MPSQPKNNHANGPAANTPVLHFEFIERVSSDPFRVDIRVLGMLEDYTHYIESLAGKRPSKDEVVEKALLKVLSSDAGFQKYLKDSAAEAKSKPEAKAPRNISTSERANDVLAHVKV